MPKNGLFWCRQNHKEKRSTPFVFQQIKELLCRERRGYGPSGNGPLWHSGTWSKSGWFEHPPVVVIVSKLVFYAQ